MKYFLFVVLMVLALPMHAHATEKPDYNAFGAWPVLHEGRIKTMESLSRSVFYDVSGTTSLNGMSAIEWMTNTVFDPVSTISEPFIAVNRNSILNLPKDRKYHSMAEVMKAMNEYEDLILALEQRDPAEYTASQRELMNTYRAVSVYNQVIQSFSAVLPLKGEDGQTFLDGAGQAEQRDLILAGGTENGLIKFIDSGNPSMPKISLWEALNAGIETPLAMEIRSMAKAWNDSDYTTWNKKAYEIGALLKSETDYPATLELEHIYVTFQPLLWATGLYILAVIGFFVYKPLSVALVAGGFVLHVTALVMRSVIMMRPPTGTLYETLLFGSAVIVIVGLALYIVNRKNLLFTALCSASAAFLLFVSRGFVQGDSLNVLVAVLNTNFWLSTHVTCIIIGYGFCIMTAMVAHYVLAVDNAHMKKLLLPLALASLLFTAVGTLLGGIWADQSWGRFWGWDPKENGALLIVLWLSWVLHGRISGHFKERGFAAALAATNIMVALTWFGVNLLGVGLHSYGFISGVAWGLGSFILAQSAVIALLYFLPKIRHPQNA